MEPADPTAPDARRESDDSGDGGLLARIALFSSLVTTTSGQQPTDTQAGSGRKETRLGRIASKTLRPFKTLKSLVRPSTASTPQPGAPSPATPAPVSRMSIGTGVPVNEQRLTFVNPFPGQPQEFTHPFPAVPHYEGNPPWVTRFDPDLVQRPTHIIPVTI